MRFDEGIESELKDWLSAITDAESTGIFNRHIIPPRLVKDAVKAIRAARRLGLLDSEKVKPKVYRPYF